MSEMMIHTDTMEDALRVSGRNTVLAAKAMTIKTNEDYTDAGGFLVEIKRRAKAVAEYWKPAKDKAKAAHQEIVDKEKAMLAPLGEAEKTIKDEMGRYQTAVERTRREAEAEARRLAREERERLLAEAVASEKSGDTLGAEIGMAMAEMVEDMPAPAMASPAPTAAGISVRKTWKARITDMDAVPVRFGGVLIRPVDTAALSGLARMTKGTATIPGVEFYEDSTIASRS